jgi:hypothetical protein
LNGAKGERSHRREGVGLDDGRGVEQRLQRHAPSPAVIREAMSWLTTPPV